MGGNKDLIIHQEYRGSRKSPLVSPVSLLEQNMYEEMARLSKQITAIKEILEGCNEKSITDDSSTGANRM